MIRGPVLPQLRASVWTKLVGQLGSIERGLELLFEGVDCCSGQFGLAEGLARDAAGAPVLVLVAVDGDGLLTARVHSACEWLERIGSSLSTALPEADLVAGTRGRVIVIGTEAGVGSLDLLARLPMPGLEICRVETFRIAGLDRLSVRWLQTGGAARRGDAAVVAHAPEFEVPASCRVVWDELRQIADRIDGGIQWDGDRFSRRVSWQGRGLGRIVVSDGALWGLDPDVSGNGIGARQPLRSKHEVRRWLDDVLRRYSWLAGFAGSSATAKRAVVSGETQAGSGDPTVAATRVPNGARTHEDDSLRATLSAARLSAEEYSALGGPTAVRGSETEHGNIADDVARIVTAKSAARYAPRRPD